MSLCKTCSSLPIRDVLRYFSGDESSLSTVFWWKDPLNPYERESKPFLRLHDTVRELECSADNCPLCQFICECLQDSFRYNTSTRKNDQNSVWLRLQFKNFDVFLGNASEPEFVVSGTISLSATRDSACAQYLDAHSVIANPLNPAVLGMIDRWLELCSGTHEDCLHKKDFETPLPTRLLDLDGLPERQDLIGYCTDWRERFQEVTFKLVEPSPGSIGQYVALSYCWGKHLAFKTTSKNLELHKEDGGISFAQLPRTLQDAVFLVRRMGFRYLWADCLCIIQDSVADWEYEASRMADVYTNSFLVVAATRAGHCGEGFLQPRALDPQLQSITFSDSEGLFTLDFKHHDSFASPGSLASAAELSPLKVQRDEPMMDRVWCFQERVLARRTVHFTRQQLYWECEQGLFRENLKPETSLDRYVEYSIQGIAKSLTGLNNLSSQGNLYELRLERKAWYEVVQEYASRNITYQSDKLPALSGIVAALQQATGDTCLAGIWRSWFLPGLLWQTQDPDFDQYAYAHKKPHRPTGWRAPSWSFAAIEGVVTYDKLPSKAEMCAEFQDCKLVPKGHNPLGELESGFARIKAPQVTVFDLESKQTINGRKGKVRLRDQTERAVAVYFDLEYYEACDVLMITPSLGLAVVPVQSKEHHFVRVGIVEVRLLGGTFYGEGFEKLSSSDWPESRSVTLL